MSDIAHWAARTFSDEDVELASGLSVRNLRTLGTAGLIQKASIGRGRGRRRAYNHAGLARAILVGAMTNLRFPLDIAAAVITFAPLEDVLVKEFVNSNIMENNSSELEESDTDLVIEIVNDTFLFISNRGPTSEYSEMLPFCFGRILTDTEGDYVETWIESLLGTPAPKSMRDTRSKQIQIEITYASPLTKLLSPEFISYLNPKEVSRRDVAMAKQHRDNPLIISSLNLSMALRAGKARLLEFTREAP